MSLAGVLGSTTTVNTVATAATTAVTGTLPGGANMGVSALSDYHIRLLERVGSLVYSNCTTGSGNNTANFVQGVLPWHLWTYTAVGLAFLVLFVVWAWFRSRYHWKTQGVTLSLWLISMVLIAFFFGVSLIEDYGNWNDGSPSCLYTAFIWSVGAIFFMWIHRLGTAHGYGPFSGRQFGDDRVFNAKKNATATIPEPFYSMWNPADKRANKLDMSGAVMTSSLWAAGYTFVALSQFSNLTYFRSTCMIFATVLCSLALIVSIAYAVVMVRAINVTAAAYDSAVMHKAENVQINKWGYVAGPIIYFVKDMLEICAAFAIAMMSWAFYTESPAVPLGTYSYTMAILVLIIFGLDLLALVIVFYPIRDKLSAWAFYWDAQIALAAYNVHVANSRGNPYQQQQQPAYNQQSLLMQQYGSGAAGLTQRSASGRV
jgi:hypothetical protein